MYGGDECAGITISYLRMKLFCTRPRTEVGERKIMGAKRNVQVFLLSIAFLLLDHCFDPSRITSV